MIAAAVASVANLSIIPAQDLLGLRSEARMNRPGTSGHSWGFRLHAGALSAGVAQRLRGLTRFHGRAVSDDEEDG